MNVGIGDGLTVLAMTSDGALNRRRCSDRGHHQLRRAGEGRALSAHHSARRSALLQSDRVTNLVVGLDSTKNTDQAYAEMMPRLNGLSQQLVLKKWIDLATYYKQVNSMFNGIFLFMGIIVFFMVLMSSVNTLLMSMFERTREIGTMLPWHAPRMDRGALHGRGHDARLWALPSAGCRQSPRSAAELVRTAHAAAPRL